MKKERKKKFIAVIGNENAGKSTIIVSLTGSPNRSFKGKIDGNLNNSSKYIYVIACSPQEHKLEDNSISKQDEMQAFQSIINDVIHKENSIGLVMAIRPTPLNPTIRLSLEDIIQKVRNTNAFESYLFVLQPDRNNSPESQQIKDAINSRLRYINADIVAQELDAKKFAFLNAQEINQASHLFI